LGAFPTTFASFALPSALSITSHHFFKQPTVYGKELGDDDEERRTNVRRRGRGEREDNSRGKHVLCVRDRNIEKAAEEECSAMVSGAKPKSGRRKVDGKMLIRITFVNVYDLLGFLFCLI
jgi:hypothetical protein